MGDITEFGFCLKPEKLLETHVCLLALCPHGPDQVNALQNLK